MPRYLIQHRTQTQTTVISHSVQPLEPIVRHLASQGQTGEVILIDADTDEVIIRAPIEPIVHEMPGDESHHGTERR